MQKTQTEMDGRKKKGEGRYVSDTEKNVWREKEPVEVLSRWLERQWP